jgi:hypothetical protein
MFGPLRMVIDMMYYYGNPSKFENSEIKNEYTRTCTACVKYVTQNQTNQCVSLSVYLIISGAVLQ